jgi:hypothetical protein
VQLNNQTSQQENLAYYQHKLIEKQFKEYINSGTHNLVGNLEDSDEIEEIREPPEGVTPVSIAAIEWGTNLYNRKEPAQPITNVDFRNTHTKSVDPWDVVKPQTSKDSAQNPTTEERSLLYQLTMPESHQKLVKEGKDYGNRRRNIHKFRKEAQEFKNLLKESNYSPEKKKELLKEAQEKSELQRLETEREIQLEHKEKLQLEAIEQKDKESKSSSDSTDPERLDSFNEINSRARFDSRSPQKHHKNEVKPEMNASGLVASTTPHQLRTASEAKVLNSQNIFNL